MTEHIELTFEAGGGQGQVSALLDRPTGARLLYLLAHGAGAGMRHPFLESLVRVLGGEGIATFRYQFPYMERRSSRPDPPRVAEATVRAAVEAAAGAAPDLPLFAGGKSFGGRMTSSAAAREPLPGVRGLVFVGFPLHPAGRPGRERADHLTAVTVPMLFLQGTRDSLADPLLVREVCDELGPRATLHVVEGADHSFHMLRRSGRTDPEVLQELARTIATWATRMVRD